MRHSICCLLVACVIILAGMVDAHAQLFYSGDGVKGGANLSTFAGNMGEKTPILGPAFGIFVRLDLNESWQIQPELLFSVKGSEYSDDYGFAKVKGTIQLAYLEVPVLMRYAAPPLGRFATSVVGGPAFGLRLDSTHDYEVRAATVEKTTGSSMSGITSVDVAIAVGVEFALQVAAGEVFVEARYSEGLVDLDTGDNEEAIRNRTAAVMLGIFFGND